MMKLNELEKNQMYVITACGGDGTYQIGYHCWVSSASPADLDCIEGGGWISFNEIPESDKLEFERCYDWVVETDSTGSRAFKITPEWIARQKEIIYQYEHNEKTS